MDLRRLQYFVAVAEELHYGRAAAKLHMSTPPLSQRIRELETELGLELFERTSRRVELTAAGRRLLDDAREVLGAVSRLESSAAALRAVSTSAADQLTVGFCHGMEAITRRAARRFHDRNPSAVIVPTARTTVRMFDDVTAGRLRLAVVRPPIPPSDQLVTTHLARVAFDHLALPEGHRLAGRAVVHASELDGESLLLVERRDAPTFHDATVAFVEQHGVRARWVEHPAAQVERMLDMVAVGTGIGWLNRYQARSLHHDGVVAVPLEPVTRFDDFYLVWRIDERSPAVEEFARIITDVVQEDEP